jgi:DNA-directed RNA polymerase specialized sigma24 family protein
VRKVMRGPSRTASLLALTPREAEVWALREVSITEIAARLGMAYPSVQRMLAVARDKMRVVDAVEKIEKRTG